MEKNDRQLLSNLEAEDGLSWKSYHPGRDEDRSMPTTVTRGANMAGIGALSRRLMARERARMLDKKPVNIQPWALELEARRWIGERARGEQATRMRTA